MSKSIETLITGPNSQALIRLANALQSGPISANDVKALGIEHPRKAFKALRFFGIETDVSTEWEFLGTTGRWVRYWTLRKAQEGL